VIVHQAISIADPVETVCDLSQYIQKDLSIAIVPEDCFAIVATGSDVVKGAIVFDS